MTTNCSKCKCGTPCGCNGGPLTTPSACPPNPCCETFDSQCVIYTGPPIMCNDQVIVPTNTPMSTIINTLVGLSCQAINTTTYDCVNGNCVEIQGTSGQYPTLQDCQADCVLAPTCINPVQYVLELAYKTYKDPDTAYNNVWDALTDILANGIVMNNNCSTYCCSDCSFACGDKIYILSNVEGFLQLGEFLGFSCDNLSNACCPNTGFDSCLDALITAGLDLPVLINGQASGVFEYSTISQQSQLCTIKTFIDTLVPADYGNSNITEGVSNILDNGLLVYCKASTGQIVIGNQDAVKSFIESLSLGGCPEKPPVIECCYNIQANVSTIGKFNEALGCNTPVLLKKK